MAKITYAKNQCNQIQLTACSYQLEKGGLWFHGIMVNGDQQIITASGRPLEREPWSYHLHMHDFQTFVHFYPESKNEKRTLRPQRSYQGTLHEFSSE